MKNIIKTPSCHFWGGAESFGAKKNGSTWKLQPHISSNNPDVVADPLPQIGAISQ